MIPAPAPAPATASQWDYPVAPQPPTRAMPVAAQQPPQPPVVAAPPVSFAYPPATSYATGYPQPASYPAPTGYPAPTAYPGYPGFQGQFPGPERQSSQASRLVIGLVLVPVALFAVVLLVKVFSAFAGFVTPEPTTVPPPNVPTSTSSPTSSAPTAPTNEPPGGYQNDDYVVPNPVLNPPSLPEPMTMSQANQWMQSNAFYNQSVPSPVRCDLVPIDPSRASKAQMQEYISDIVGCLMRVWAPEMQAAGYDVSRPSVTVYSTSGQSACGRLQRQNAFYCAGDQQIYYSLDLPTMMPQYQDDPILPMQIIAHEFGHAIQAQTGILWSESMVQQSYTDRNDDASAMQISRRTEMQADCFAGAFINAVSYSVGISQDENQVLVTIMAQLGDDAVTGIPGYSADHGLGVNRQYWFQTGMTDPSVGACNTFSPDVASSKLK